MGVAMSFATSQALAADFSDPTWPCIQRKVAGLSMGLMWQNPTENVALGDDLKGPVHDLAAALTLQRVDMDAAKGMVTDFTARHGADRDVLQEVFAQVFHSVESRRTRIMGGIGRVSTGQIELAQRIDDARSEMDRLMALPEPDYDQVDKLEEQLDWDDRIYRERQQTVSYLCESPVLLEKRLFAIAQLLQEAAG
ncbi:hypothetical protein HJ536_07110 [Donghicola sp. B5-SW-15]|uniref:Uncharacterized protein n=2 Tax=Donghicola mangrovi TaxID=2729614 RepID=A0A850Q8P9_9RHOB|nr:hypothetical protein [Donghicola mangrovi]